MYDDLSILQLSSESGVMKKFPPDYSALFD